MPTPPSCGNGLVESGEECEIDDQCGDGWICNEACSCELGVFCGNGILEPGNGEECDGDPSPCGGGFCSLGCTCETVDPCGNGQIDVGEECGEPGLDCAGAFEICTGCICEDTCGDGAVNNGEACDLSSGADTCGPGFSCNAACGCDENPPLGALSLSVSPGPSGLCASDYSGQSWFKIYGQPTDTFVGDVCSGTRGNFQGTLELVGGSTDADGIASLDLSATTVVKAQRPSQSSDDWECWRFQPHPTLGGWVDCDGGSGADVSLTVDSHGSGANDAPVLSYPGDGTANPPNASTAGHAIIPVLVQQTGAPNSGNNCGDVSWGAVPAEEAVLTTGVATVTIENALRCPGGSSLAGSCPAPDGLGRYVNVLDGTRFDCGDWTANGNVGLVLPGFTLDQDFGSGGGATFGVGDVTSNFRMFD